MAVGSMK